MGEITSFGPLFVSCVLFFILTFDFVPSFGPNKPGGTGGQKDNSILCFLFLRVGLWGWGVSSRVHLASPPEDLGQVKPRRRTELGF